MTWHLGVKSKQRLVGVHPDLVDVCYRALDISPIDFGIPASGGLRSIERQQKLFDDGRSKCDGIFKKSKHQTGLALDFYAYVDGGASWYEHHLTQVAAAFLQAASELGIALQWGGHWKSFVDMPHVQLMD